MVAERRFARLWEEKYQAVYFFFKRA